MAIERWRGEDAPPEGQGWQIQRQGKGEVSYIRTVPEKQVDNFEGQLLGPTFLEPALAPQPISEKDKRIIELIKAEPPPFDPNNPVGMGDAGIQVVVYGPDGTAYGTPAAARAAGVTNYSMSPPAAAAPAAPAYTQQYVPGATRARDEENNEIQLPSGYGAPIYGAASGRDRGGGNQLIGRVGMVPVVTANNRDGPPIITFADDPTYKKSQKQIDFEKQVASGAIESTGMYENTSGEKGERAFADRNAAYTSYDPATNIVRFYDPEGNVTQEGQRSSGGGGLFGGISSALTNVLQPVEKVATAVASDPKALTAIALAVAIPGIGAAIGESLMAAGVVTSAEAATAAATAAGATAAQAAAAGAAATATATAIGTAVASTAAQVAQGTPVDKAITNTLVNVGISQVSPVVAQEINNFIGHPAVSDAITSAAASGVKTAAAGGSSEDITTAMTANLAGSAANSAYSSAANDYNSTTGKVLGSATAGAVTGGAAGALNNALTTAASSIGTPKPLGDISTKPVAAVDGGGGDAEVLPGQEDSLGGAAPTPPIDATVNIPPSPVAGLDITQDESAAETARLAAKNAELAAATTTPAPVTRDQQILDLIATPSNVEPTATAAPTPAPSVVEPPQGAYLPEATPEPVPAPAPEPTPAPAPNPDQAILDLINQPAVEPTPAPTPVTTPVSEAIQPAPVAELYSGSMPDESAAETERLARLNQQATAPPVVEPTQGAYLPASTIDQQILDLIAEKPATTDVEAVGDVPATPDKTPITEPPVEEPITAVEPPVEVDADIPRVEVSGVGNIEPPQGAYLPDTVPAESTAIEPAPVAEGYSTSMPDESQAETDRLARREQEILNLITPAPVAEEPKQGAFLPDTVPAPEAPDIPAADPMSQDPAQQAQAAADVPAVEVTPSTGTGLIDTPPVSDTDKQILDLISEEPTEDQSDAETERLARKEAELAGAEKGAYLPDSGTDTTPSTNTYKPTIFSVTNLSPKTRTAAPTSALGAALGTTGLTSYRGAGEIEGTGSGKPRKNVWNVESLKLKDALGV